jgi:hypothetical protein
LRNLATNFGKKDNQDKPQSFGDSPTERGRIGSVRLRCAALKLSAKTETNFSKKESPVGYSAQLSPGQAAFRTVCPTVTTISAALLTTDMKKQEFTSDQTNTPSTMATTANNSIEYSTGSVESPTRVCHAIASANQHASQLTRFKVRTEHLASANINPEDSPGGGLQRSFGGATSNVLTGSVALAAASERTTTVISPRPSFTALESSDTPAPMGIPGGFGGIGGLAAQQHGGEADGQRPLAAPLAEGGTQPTPLLLLQALLQKDMRAADDEGADFGMSLSSSRWFGMQAHTLAQVTCMMLVGLLVSAMFASITGSSAMFCFASLVPIMGAVLQSFGIAQSDLKSFWTTPSTMSSSRSSELGSPFYRLKGSFTIGKAQPSVLRHEISRLTSIFSSLSQSRSSTSSFVAPLLG